MDHLHSSLKIWESVVSCQIGHPGIEITKFLDSTAEEEIRCVFIGY